jgi:N-acetylglucosaminyl-diphospho-decaprenol L-rhamnosyltransferase
VEADPVRDYGGGLAVVTATRAGLPGPGPLLGSLEAATTRPVGIVVADSASRSQPSVPPGVEVVRLAEDVGRAAAVNRAVAALPEAVGSEVIADPDVCWRPGALDVLLAAADPRAGLLGPRLWCPAGLALPSGGPLPGLLAAMRGRVPAHVPTAGAVPWLSTAAVLLRRSAWDSVDGLDARYLGGAGDAGDADLGDRLGRAGWLAVHEPAAGVDLRPVGEEGGEPARTGQGILESHLTGLRRYVHDRGSAPARVLLALGAALRRG